MEAIYFSRPMCDDLGIDYGGEGEKVRLSPRVLIRMKAGGYDSTHMAFFWKVGMDTEMRLRHRGYGWMEVLSKHGTRLAPGPVMDRPELLLAADLLGMTPSQARDLYMTSPSLFAARVLRELSAQKRMLQEVGDE